MYPGYTLLWWPWVYIAGAYLYHYYTLCTLDTHCYDDPGYTMLVLIYNTSIPMYPGYTLLWWPWVYIAGAFLYHYYTLCTLDTHCYDDPGYTLLVLIYNTSIPYIPWIHIAGAYLYHYYTLCTQDTHCYNDPGYTLLVLIYNTSIPYVPWIHIVMMTLGIHCWCLSISLLYLMYPGYTLLWWPWVYIAGAYL